MGETETNAHRRVWMATNSLLSFQVSFSSIIIIYISFTVNAHRFLQPYAKETESNHFTMLHPFLNVYVTLVKLYCVGGKSASLPLLSFFSPTQLFLGWIIFRFMVVSLLFTCCRLTSFDDEFTSYTK